MTYSNATIVAATPNISPLAVWQPRPVVLGVDGLCGAGKSHAAIEELADRIMAGERWLIAGPTAVQTSQFHADLEAALNRRRPLAGVLAMQINSETLRSSADEDERVTVAQRLAEEIDAHELAEVFTPFRDEASRRIRRARRALVGRAIIITHAALLLLPHSAKPVGWHLLIDEAPTAIEAIEVTLPSRILAGLRFHDEDGRMRMVADAAFLRGQLERVELRRREWTQGARMAKSAGDPARAADLMEAATRLRTSTENPLREMVRRISSGNWHIFVSRRAVEPSGGGSLPRFRLTLSAGERSTVVLVHAVDWRGVLGEVRWRWESVTLMAANLEDTFAAMTLRRQGYDIRPHAALVARLRYLGAHPNGEGLTLLYALSRRASKKKRDTVVEGETVGQHIINAVEALFPDGNYAWTANKDVPDGALRGERMPYVSHGLNRFQHHRNVVVLNISNLKPQAAAALEEHGFTTDEIRRAVMNECCYQAFMRGASRDPNCTAPRIGVLIDAEVSQFIADRMPGVMVGALGSPEPPVKVGGRPRLHEDNAERKKGNKADQRQRDKDRLSAAVANFRDDCLDLTEPHRAWLVCLYTELASWKAFRSDTFDTFDAMVRWLRREHERIIAAKEDSHLVLAGDVPQAPIPVPDNWPRNSEGKPTFRARANIVCRSSIWLDIESLGGGASGAPVPWSEIKRIFTGLRLVGYSSFKHLGAAPRYRVVIPLSVACGVPAYEAIYGMVMHRVAAAGWLAWREGAAAPGPGVRYSGIDASKRPATSIFYVPGKRAGFEDEAWFEDVAGEPLDVAAWLADDRAVARVLPAAYRPEAAEPPLAYRPLSGVERFCLAAKVDRAVAQYLLAARGTQNDELFILGWRLAGYGCALAEIETHLRAAVPRSHSPGDRDRDVPRILADIRRRKVGIA